MELPFKAGATSPIFVFLQWEVDDEVEIRHLSLIRLQRYTKEPQMDELASSLLYLQDVGELQGHEWCTMVMSAIYFQIDAIENLQFLDSSRLYTKTVISAC